MSSQTSISLQRYEQLGRFQIYGAGDEIRHALAEAEGLFAMIERLEHELRRCTSIAHRGQHREPSCGAVVISAEI